MSVERFIEGLCALDLDPELLRRAPDGEGWLPADLRRMAAEDPACAVELAEFVAMELELHQQGQGAGLGPSDAFFTRQVMDRLPEIEAIDERRRTWILASAYALAIGVAYVLVGPLLSSGTLSGTLGSVFGSVSDSLSAWGHSHAHALEASGAWVALAMLLLAGVLCIAPTDRRQADATVDA